MSYWARLTLFQKVLVSPEVRNSLIHSNSNSLLTSNLFKVLTAKRNLLKFTGVNIKANIGRGISVVNLVFITEDLGQLPFTLTYELKTKEYKVTR